MWKLFLDDERYPIDGSWIIARTFDDACWFITHYGLPTFISFDHDLGSIKTGMDFAKWFSNHVLDHRVTLPTGFSFYVHSQNPVGAENIKSYMQAFIASLENGAP
jgi:hypothetical protein